MTSNNTNFDESNCILIKKGNSLLILDNDDYIYLKSIGFLDCSKEVESLKNLNLSDLIFKVKNTNAINNINYTGK